MEYSFSFLFFLRRKLYFSSCSGWGPLSSCGAWASHCRGFSCGRAQGLGHGGSSSCSSWALEHRLRSCGTWALLLLGMWNLPGPGIEPESPALAGGLDTTESPGNHQSWNILDSRKKIAKGWH